MFEVPDFALILSRRLVKHRSQAHFPHGSGSRMVLELSRGLLLREINSPGRGEMFISPSSGCGECLGGQSVFLSLEVESRVGISALATVRGVFASPD